MNTFLQRSLLLILSAISLSSFAQNVIEDYAPPQKDSLRIGPGANDFLPYIQQGYTLMLPEATPIKGVLIFLEDSGYDQKNKSAQQLYPHAAENGFAVLSVSTEIPFDFYFEESSMHAAHKIVHEAFTEHQLPNQNVFFLGAGLTGHRAMRYLKFVHDVTPEFQLNVEGLILCNFTMDFTRKWHQHERDIRINRIHLGEPRFINYMLESHLGGTPATHPSNYHDFSVYSYSDEQQRNIAVYKDYTVRVYIEPAIEHKLTTQYRTLYENNATDMVGFLAELALAGNERTDLVVIQPEDNPAEQKNTQASWNAIDKKELMVWIVQQVALEE